MGEDTYSTGVCHCTHTLVLVPVFTTARTGYMAPIQGVSQQEVTRLVVSLAVTAHTDTHTHTCTPFPSPRRRV